MPEREPVDVKLYVGVIERELVGVNEFDDVHVLDFDLEFVEVLDIVFVKVGLLVPKRDIPETTHNHVTIVKTLII